MFNPLSLLSSAGSAIAGFFGGFQTYLITGALALAVGGAGGAWVGYRMESGKVAAIRAADAEAETQAVTKAAAISTAQSAVNTNAAIADAQAQASISAPHIVIRTEIKNVPPILPACSGLSVRLARLLYAAAAQDDPATIPLATGQSDDDCSDFTVAEVAGWFNDYSAASQANSKQLNDLEEWVAKNHTAQEAP